MHNFVFKTFLNWCIFTELKEFNLLAHECSKFCNTSFALTLTEVVS